jgi:hypothetical protein
MSLIKAYQALIGTLEAQDPDAADAIDALSP